MVSASVVVVGIVVSRIVVCRRGDVLRGSSLISLLGFSSYIEFTFSVGVTSVIGFAVGSTCMKKVVHFFCFSCDRKPSEDYSLFIHYFLAVCCRHGVF